MWVGQVEVNAPYKNAPYKNDLGYAAIPTTSF